MIRLIGIVIAIGLADSLNPSTVAPALYLASGRDAGRCVAKFSAGVFVVYFLGGMVIALGPGALVLSIVPRPDHQTTQVLEVVAGVVLITVGLLLWRYRAPLGNRKLPDVDSKGHTSWVLGASITAVELPTAFPYFGALTAVVTLVTWLFAGCESVCALNALAVLVSKPAAFGSTTMASVAALPLGRMPTE